MPKKKQPLQEIYGLGKPRKRERLSKREKLALNYESLRRKTVLKMGEYSRELEKRRFKK